MRRPTRRGDFRDFVQDPDSGLLVPRGELVQGRKILEASVGPLFFAPLALVGLFDPVNVPLLYTLSADNRTITSTSVVANTCCVGMTRRSTGKYYFEFTLTTRNGGFLDIGCSKGTPNVNVKDTQPGDSTSSWGWLNGNSGYHAGSTTSYGSGGVIVAGETAAIAVDFTNSKIFVARGNVWQGSGDPVAGTNPMYANINGSCCAVLNLYFGAGPNIGIGNFTAAQQVYAPPTGYTAWDD